MIKIIMEVDLERKSTKTSIQYGKEIRFIPSCSCGGVGISVKKEKGQIKFNCLKCKKNRLAIKE